MMLALAAWTDFFVGVLSRRRSLTAPSISTVNRLIEIRSRKTAGMLETWISLVAEAVLPDGVNTDAAVVLCTSDIFHFLRKMGGRRRKTLPQQTKSLGQVYKTKTQ